jgi:hypothetical protein
VRIAAIVAVALLLVVTAFQISLALGAPFGKAAWGGRHEGVLPKRLRIASGAAGIVVYPLVILAVLSFSGVIDKRVLPGNGEIVAWLLAGIFLLGGLANLASSSVPERYWAPVSIVVATCCAIIATVKGTETPFAPLAVRRNMSAS